jgi:hypothetical protein
VIVRSLESVDVPQALIVEGERAPSASAPSRAVQVATLVVPVAVAGCLYLSVAR